MNVTHLRCTICEADYPGGEVEYTCPKCGLEGILDVHYDYDAVAREISVERLGADPRRTIWRYLPLLPLPADAKLPRPSVGWTPIYDAPALAADIGVARVHVKDDGRNPTASYKDRASSVGVARAVALGSTDVSCSSTGNAASSMAGMAADMGVRAHIFVPASAPEGKVSQLLVYGAEVFLVDGDYAVAWDLAQEAAGHFGWYNRNCAVNPFLVEGKKTGGLELAEQMRNDLPDVIAMAVGDGCSIAGVGKGLEEMHRLGIIDRIPRLLGVQAEGAKPIADAYAAGVEELSFGDATTFADSISVGAPRNWRKALRAVRRSGGDYVTVSDDQIRELIPRQAQLSGVFGEPAAVAALAGVYEARGKGLIAADEKVLVYCTGNGLKDVRSAIEAVTMPDKVAPNLDAVKARIEANAGGVA